MKYLFTLLIVLMFVSCGGGGIVDNTPKPILTSSINGFECGDSGIVSNDELILHDGNHDFEQLGITNKNYVVIWGQRYNVLEVGYDAWHARTELILKRPVPWSHGNWILWPVGTPYSLY